MAKYTDAEIARADGPFDPPAAFTTDYIKASIARIARFPDDLERVVKGLTKEQQATPYRQGGWSLAQVIHHVADSHMQAFSRFKLTLTEDTPVIKPYIQNAWADTADSLQGDVQWSVELIRALHKRFVLLMENMGEADFKKCYFHPEYQKTYSLEYVAGMYAWHGYHHLQQIEMYLENQNQTAG
ncbi:MAG: putative metal-dependent hydrolase [Bacteroidota bacterium]